MGIINFKALPCLIICMIIGRRGVDSQSYANATDLRSSLLASYNTDLIPVNNQSEVISVTVSLSLYSQPDVDPIRGSISTAMVFNAEWTDELITWTPSQHEGIDSILIKSTDVWTPTITVAQSMTFQPLDGSWIRIPYKSNGSALFTPGDVYETSCSFSMKYWPFDKHACYITFYSYDYTTDKLRFVASNSPITTTYYVQNGEWYLNIDSIDHRIGATNVPSITFKLIYERQPTFYLLTIIFPLVGLIALNSFVFLLERVPRIGFSLTIMLSLAVYLTVVTDELPKLSDPIPIMCEFILFVVAVSIISTIIVILNLKLYNRTRDVPKAWLFKMIVRFSQCRRNRVNGNPDDSEGTNSVNKPMAQTNEAAQPNKADADNNIADKNDDNITWQDVSEALDKILFYAFLIVTYVPSIIIIMSLALASKHDDDSIYWNL